jgi:serine/threonine protein kinase/Tfp pilus assembly protein PilF
MGEIYRARDTRLNRDVAVKILPESLTNDQSAIERFTREARAVSALNHPNILTIFDIGEQDDIRFIATEFVEGETLRQKMQSSPLTVAEVLDIAIQVADALNAAHEAGIIHRDIKPENIMLRADGYVKVLDFGIAKLTEPHITEAGGDTTLVQTATTPGMIIGTISYMSPEQARGELVDHRSDIFSLGVVIYEMISRHLPFGGETASDMLASILLREPTPLSEYVKNVPQELEFSITRSLAKNREERYQKADDLLADLKRLRRHLEFITETRRANGSSGANKQSISESTTMILPGAGQAIALAPVRKTRKAIDSLAVLPLLNNSQDEETEYLSDGITESIINSLSKLPKLRVVPRSTVFRYKGNTADPQQIGRELGVRAVFTGRIVYVGDSLIVNAELIDVENEAQLWGDRYRRKTTNILNLLDDLSEDISEKLRLRLSGNQKKKLAKRYTRNAEAYQFYLKGRYFVTAKRTEEWIKKGIEYFQKAVDLDPSYALAYSGIAEAYGFLASSTGGWPPHEAYPKAKAAALKALEIDDTLGEAHCSLGFFRLLYDWNWTQAEREFKKAIRITPNFPNAYDGLGFYLKAMGRHDEAIEECKKAQKLDPLSPFAHISLGYGYYFARDYASVIDECNKALEMDRYSPFAYRTLGLAKLQQGELGSAINALSKAVTFSNNNPAFESYLGFAYAVTGKRTEAEEVLANLHRAAERHYIPAFTFALVHLGLNEHDKAFEWLNKGLEERSGFLPFLKVEPLLDSIRHDQRFSDLLLRVGLPEIDTSLAEQSR